MSKLIKFCKENRILVLAFFAIVLTFAFLAIPGQFVHFDLIKGTSFKYHLSGYQFIFSVDQDGLPQVVSTQGLSIFVLLVLSFVALFFSKKSSFVELVLGLALITISVLFFTISVEGGKIYPAFLKNDYRYSWVPFVSGGLLVLSGILLIYGSIMRMKDEIKHPSQPKGPSYNYLHK